MFVQSHIQRAHRHNHNNNNHHNQQRQQSAINSTGAIQRDNSTSAATSCHSTRSNHLIERQTAIDSGGDCKRSQQKDGQESSRTLIKLQRIKRRVVGTQTLDIPLNRSHDRLADQSKFGRNFAGLVASGSLNSDRQMGLQSADVTENSSTTCECEQRKKLLLTSPSESIGKGATRTVTAIATFRLRSSTTSGTLEPEGQILEQPKRDSELCPKASSQLFSAASKLENTSDQLKERAESQFKTLEILQQAPNNLCTKDPKLQFRTRDLSLRSSRVLEQKNQAEKRRSNCIRVLVVRRNSTRLNHLRILTKINLSNLIRQARRLGIVQISEINHRRKIDRSNESFDQCNTFTSNKLMGSIQLYCSLLLNSYFKLAPHIILLYLSHFFLVQRETIKSLFARLLNLVRDICFGAASKLCSHFTRIDLASPEMRNSFAKSEVSQRRRGRAFCRESNVEGAQSSAISMLDIADESQQDVLLNYHNAHNDCCCSVNQNHRAHGQADLTSESATYHQIDARDHYPHQHQASSLFSSIRTNSSSISRLSPSDRQVSFGANGPTMLPLSHSPSAHQHAFNLSHRDWCKGQTNIDLDQQYWRPADLDRHQEAFCYQPMSGSFDEPILQPDGARGPAYIHQRRISTSSPILFEAEQIPANRCEWLHPSEPVASYADTLMMQTHLDRCRELETRARDNMNHRAQSQFTRTKVIAPHHFHPGQQCPLTAQMAIGSHLHPVVCHRSYASSQPISCVTAENKPFQRKLSSIIGSDSELCKRSSKFVGPLNFSSSSASSSLSSDANHLIRLVRPLADLATLKRRPDLLGDFRECPPRRTVQSSSGRHLCSQTSSVTSETSSGKRHNPRGQHQTGCCDNRQARASECVTKSLASPCDNVARGRCPSASSRTNSSNNNNETKAWTTSHRLADHKSASHQIEADSVAGVSDDGAKRKSNSEKVNLAVSGKSKSMNHSLSPIAATLGRVSLAGAKRRLGFKQTRGLNSLNVHRSEEIFPSDFGAGLLVRQHTSTTTTTTNTTPGSYSLNDSGDLDQLQQQQLRLASGNGLAHNKWLDRFNSESPDPKVCFVDGLGLGQIVSRQALVSPYLGDIQISLSDRRGMLEVEVIRVRQLQTKPGAKRQPSVYVKVYLMRNKKCLAKFKTNSISNTLDPLYQQLFIFRDDYSNCVLQIIVWGDYGKHDRKSLMGIAQIHLNDLDISSVLIGWYKLFNAPSMATSQSMASSSKSLRQTLSATKLTDLDVAQQPL